MLFTFFTQVPFTNSTCWFTDPGHSKQAVGKNDDYPYRKFPINLSSKLRTHRIRARQERKQKCDCSHANRHSGVAHVGEEGDDEVDGDFDDRAQPLAESDAPKRGDDWHEN